MTSPSTGIDFQRSTFVESLHNSLRKQASEAIVEHKKLVAFANSYIQDGLEEHECVELLMIDGLTREAAESYTAMALSDNGKNDDYLLPEYSFQFEDVHGKRWSNYDIGRTIRAANENEAWTEAENVLNEDSSVEFQKLLSISRVDTDASNF